MASNYTVETQRQTTDLGPDGRFQDVMEVTFVTRTGVTGNVRIPLRQYNADTVREAIEARVAEIDAVNDL